MRLIILTGFAAFALAQDPVHFKTEIDNTWVRMLRETVGPREKVALHRHSPSVVIYSTDVHERLTGANGKAREVRHKKDDVAYFNAYAPSQ